MLILAEKVKKGNYIKNKFYILKTKIPTEKHRGFCSGDG